MSSIISVGFSLGLLFLANTWHKYSGTHGKCFLFDTLMLSIIFGNKKPSKIIASETDATEFHPEGAWKAVHIINIIAYKV